MSKQKLLSLTNDYIFKRTFGYAGDEEVTQVFLKDILQSEVTSIKLDNNPITEKELMDDKVGIMDIKAVLNNNIQCNIEMQIVNEHNIEKRILFYWAKMYTQSIKEGDEYKNLKKSICVLIADFELEKLKDIEKYITKWNIREEDYKSVILTEVLELVIIELPKFMKYAKKREIKNLNLWVEFIKNSEVKFMSEEYNDESLKETKKAIEKAQKNLEKISEDEHERYLAELREKYIRDQHAIQEFGYEKGKAEGREEGKAEGRIENQIKIAKKLIKQGFTTDEIADITELEKDEIEKLR